jgi:hypothetical protein
MLSDVPVSCLSLKVNLRNRRQCKRTELLTHGGHLKLGSVDRGAEQLEKAAK